MGRQRKRGVSADVEQWARWQARANADPRGLSLNAWVVWALDEVGRLAELEERERSEVAGVEGADEGGEPAPAPAERRELSEAEILAINARSRARRQQPNYYTPASVRRAQEELEDSERSWNKQIREAGGNPYA